LKAISIDIIKNWAKSTTVKRKKIFDKEDAKQVGGRDKVLKFHKSEKFLEIERKNELLLGRLVEISRKRTNPLFPLNEPTNNTKSLNNNARKKEKDRIAAENEAFARRLLSQQPSFNRRKLDDDFDKHSERVRLMQKAVGYNPKLKLPPIQYNKYDDYEDTRKSQSGKEKRSVKDLTKKKRRKSHKIDEKEEFNEAEETREVEEAERNENEAREQKEKEERLKQQENERRANQEKELQEQKVKEQREKEEAERKAKDAKEEQERLEKLKKEEEEKKLKLEAENKKLAEEKAKQK